MTNRDTSQFAHDSMKTRSFSKDDPHAHKTHCTFNTNYCTYMHTCVHAHVNTINSVFGLDSDYGRSCYTLFHITTSSFTYISLYPHAIFALTSVLASPFLNSFLVA